MDTPLVSFVVPMYNVQKTIRRCVESICSQTYQNIEVILLNDGSKDDTLSICQEYAEKDPRITLINKPNSGCCATRNKGLTLTHGKYIQLVDSDDWLEPTFTERLVTAAEKYDADLVIAPYWMTVPLEDVGRDENGDYQLETREYNYLPAGIYDQATYARQLMRKPNTFFFGVIWNKIYRRDIIMKHNLRFSSELFSEDAYFNVRYLQYVHKAVSIPGPGYYYYQNPQSICHSLKLSTIAYDRMRVLHRYSSLFRQLGMEKEMRLPIVRSLFLNAESVRPAGFLQKLQDMTSQI